jgi:serine/threonine protein kinase
MGEVPIHNAQVITTAPECKYQPAYKIVIEGVRTYYIATACQEETDSWISVLEQARLGTSGTWNKPPETSVEDFKVLRCLPRGTTGLADLVEHRQTGQLYVMKSVSKRVLMDEEEIEQVQAERAVFINTVHPFLVRAYWTFETVRYLYFIVDYVPGGDLFTRLLEKGKFSETRVRLYAAEIALALGHLHRQALVYRDLKLANLLVDDDGHLKLSDFGIPHSPTPTFGVMPEYTAPELLKGQPYTRAVDWWNFGILLYEMLVGCTPFDAHNNSSRSMAILTSHVTFPVGSVSATAQDLICKLLEKDPVMRLGSGPTDFEEIKRHDFFQELNWNQVMNKETLSGCKQQTRVLDNNASSPNEDICGFSCYILDKYGQIVAVSNSNAIKGRAACN